MKRIALSLCAAFAFGASGINAASTNDEDYTAAWLRKGCTLTEVLKAEGKSGFEKWDARQEKTYYAVIHFFNGFLRGINNSAFHFERGAVPKVLFPPVEWQTWGNVAPQILSFMQKHQDKIREDTPASDVLAAWAWAEHPDATERNKLMSRIALERHLEKGN